MDLLRVLPHTLSPGQDAWAVRPLLQYCIYMLEGAVEALYICFTALLRLCVLSLCTRLTTILASGEQGLELVRRARTRAS